MEYRKAHAPGPWPIHGQSFPKRVFTIGLYAIQMPDPDL